MHGTVALRNRGVTMIEVLVVSGVIAVLASVLLPSLAAARAAAKTMVCATQLSQVVRANLYYADENESTYCAGAELMRLHANEEGVRPTAAQRAEVNLRRWYGRRASRHAPMEPTGGPLAPYLDESGRIRECPAFVTADLAPSRNRFEQAAGGYGYNNAFIGRQLHRYESGAYEVVSDAGGARTHSVKKPLQTIMFADAAFAGDTLIEYSFVEPRYRLDNPVYRFDPSIHFRHRGSANVGWVDGHVDASRMTFTYSSGFYEAKPEQYDIGWFGQSDDNRLFDLD